MGGPVIAASDVTVVSPYSGPMRCHHELWPSCSENSKNVLAVSASSLSEAMVTRLIGERSAPSVVGTRGNGRWGGTTQGDSDVHATRTVWSATKKRGRIARNENDHSAALTARA